MYSMIDGCGPLNHKKNGIKVIHEGITKTRSIGLGILKHLYFEDNNFKYARLYNNRITGRYSEIKKIKIKK